MSIKIKSISANTQLNPVATSGLISSNFQAPQTPLGTPINIPENIISANFQSSSIDVFGDIIIGRNQLVLLRGGWEDSNGNRYESSPIRGKLGPLNIIILGKPVPNNFNTQLNKTTRQSIVNG